MKLEFTKEPITFDGVACSRAIMKIAENYMSETSDKMVAIMRVWVDKLGNGSHIMRADAVAAVREILREVTSEYINIEVGVDEAMAKSMSEEFFIRTMVVLHGNQAGGPIKTKPGQTTWKKNVTYSSVNTYSQSVYNIPQFDWRFDVAAGVVEMTMKEIEKYFKDMLSSIEKICTAEFFASFLH